MGGRGEPSVLVWGGVVSLVSLCGGRGEPSVLVWGGMVSLVSLCGGAW